MRILKRLLAVIMTFGFALLFVIMIVITLIDIPIWTITGKHILMWYFDVPVENYIFFYDKLLKV